MASNTIKSVGSIQNEMDDERVMNDSTMPPPKNGTNKSAMKNIAAKKIASGPRKKAGRFGLADWTRLLAVSKDLARLQGRPIRQAIPWNEIKKHNSVHDGWMVLKGKVYNITPYLAYHPGGEKILRSSLGRDGTALYEKYHRWVNEDGLIGKLLIGYLDKTSKYESDDDSDDDDDVPTYSIPSTVDPATSTAKSKDGFSIPAVPKKN